MRWGQGRIAILALDGSTLGADRYEMDAYLVYA